MTLARDAQFIADDFNARACVRAGFDDVADLSCDRHDVPRLLICRSYPIARTMQHDNAEMVKRPLTFTAR
jgi:hypothetical protein